MRVQTPLLTQKEKTMDPEWKELLEEIKRNNAVQEDLNKKWRQERGLPDPEPTELQLVFQRWVRSAEAPLSPVPEGEAPLSLPLPEPRGEEPPLPEPRGEEPPLPEPREEVKKIPPPQPRPPPLKTSPAPDGAVPCPDVVVPLPECQDLSPLVLRSDVACAPPFPHFVPPEAPGVAAWFRSRTPLPVTACSWLPPCTPVALVKPSGFPLAGSRSLPGDAGGTNPSSSPPAGRGEN
ncbi:UNVERIFIED_CONTAM: hypothetical protein FKN15_070960 [Acipenser sinensis]